jgi:hypothetical protein
LLGSRVGLADFGLEPGDLGLEGFVFRDLALEEAVMRALASMPLGVST